MLVKILTYKTKKQFEGHQHSVSRKQQRYRVMTSTGFFALVLLTILTFYINSVQPVTTTNPWRVCSEYCSNYTSRTTNHILGVLCKCEMEDCYNPTGESCEWYSDCLQSAYPTCTGASNYALNYGKYFCDRYNQRWDKFSPNAQAWISRAKKCLQIALVPLLNIAGKISCDELKSKAFATHPSCYVDCGFCDIGFKNWVEVFITIDRAFTTDLNESLRGVVESLARCADGNTPSGGCLGTNSSMIL